MIVCQNLHTHTTYCDGKNTVEEMIISAVNKGMTSIGFSGHALTPHDLSYCMSEKNTLKYKADISELKEKYRDIINVYLGLEQDYYSSQPLFECDYLIGSVHYVLKDGEYIPVDETKEIITNAVNRLYGGDIYSFLEDYFSNVENIADKTDCDIVGHLDLPEKFNGDGCLFDRENPRYINAYTKAVKKLIAQNKIFEINTGAIYRGYTALPYPHKNILELIANLGGKITVSSDSHDVNSIDFKLNDMCSLAKSCGFTEIYQLTQLGFEPNKILE